MGADTKEEWTAFLKEIEEEERQLKGAKILKFPGPVEKLEAKYGKPVFRDCQECRNTGKLLIPRGDNNLYVFRCHCDRGAINSNYPAYFSPGLRVAR